MDDDYVSYTKATSAWPRGDILQIVSAADTVIASFPIQFVRQGGDNTWRYIAFVVSLLVIVDPAHPCVIVDAAFHPVALDEQPDAGVFRYVEFAAGGYRAMIPSDLEDAVTEVRFAPGPEYYSSQIAPAGMVGSSTAGSSDDSRSIPDQVRTIARAKPMIDLLSRANGCSRWYLSRHRTSAATVRRCPSCTSKQA